jgi:hypothetical protein
MITNNAKCKREIKSRIVMEKAAFKRKKAGARYRSVGLFV